MILLIMLITRSTRSNITVVLPLFPSIYLGQERGCLRRIQNSSATFYSIIGLLRHPWLLCCSPPRPQGGRELRWGWELTDATQPGKLTVTYVSEHEFPISSKNKPPQRKGRVWPAQKSKASFSNMSKIIKRLILRWYQAQFLPDVVTQIMLK